MQTFLPYADFILSLKALDQKRLGKQRVEAMQLIKAIEGAPRLDGNPYRGWVHHPATIMWKKYPDALKLYYNFAIFIWESMGFQNSLELFELPDIVKAPEWLGFEPFHSSHRSNLLKKDYDFYMKYQWSDDPKNLYIWLDESLKWYSFDRTTNQRIYLTDLKYVPKKQEIHYSYKPLQFSLIICD
jgi:hypothetical protein